MEKTFKSIDKIDYDNILGDEVVVFGSRIDGKHGQLLRPDITKLGAIPGNPRGLQGKTYSIPIYCSRGIVLSLPEVKAGIRDFLEYAKDNRFDTTFLVERIACGPREHHYQAVAPLFADVLKYNLNHVVLPTEFLTYLQNHFRENAA